MGNVISRLRCNYRKATRKNNKPVSQSKENTENNSKSAIRNLNKSCTQTAPPETAVLKPTYSQNEPILSYSPKRLSDIALHAIGTSKSLLPLLIKSLKPVFRDEQFPTEHQPDLLHGILQGSARPKQDKSDTSFVKAQFYSGTNASPDYQKLGNNNFRSLLATPTMHKEFAFQLSDYRGVNDQIVNTKDHIEATDTDIVSEIQEATLSKKETQKSEIADSKLISKELESGRNEEQTARDKNTKFDENSITERIEATIDEKLAKDKNKTNSGIKRITAVPKTKAEESPISVDAHIKLEEHSITDGVKASKTEELVYYKVQSKNKEETVTEKCSISHGPEYLETIEAKSMENGNKMNPEDPVEEIPAEGTKGISLHEPACTVIEYQKCQFEHIGNFREDTTATDLYQELSQSEFVDINQSESAETETKLGHFHVTQNAYNENSTPASPKLLQTQPYTEGNLVKEKHTPAEVKKEQSVSERTETAPSTNLILLNIKITKKECKKYRKPISNYSDYRLPDPFYHFKSLCAKKDSLPVLFKRLFAVVASQENYWNQTLLPYKSMWKDVAERLQNESSRASPEEIDLVESPYGMVAIPLGYNDTTQEEDDTPDPSPSSTNTDNDTANSNLDSIQQIDTACKISNEEQNPHSFSPENDINSHAFPHQVPTHVPFPFCHWNYRQGHVFPRSGPRPRAQAEYPRSGPRRGICGYCGIYRLMNSDLCPSCNVRPRQRRVPFIPRYGYDPHYWNTCYYRNRYNHM